MEIGKKIYWYKNNNWILPKDEQIWNKIYDDSNFPINKWYCGGMTNASFNELDKHLYSNNGDKILFIDDQKSITIRNFHSLVIFCSRYLKSLGLKKGDRILIKLPNSINSAAWITACKRNAIIYSCIIFDAPTQTIESRYQDLQAKIIIDDTFPDPSAFIINEEFAELANLSDYQYITKINQLEPIQIVESNFPLFIAYTSGSTGKSKGITHTHGGYTAGIKATMDYVFDTKDNDIIFTIGSFGWITGQSYMLSGPMQAGITSLLIDGNIIGSNPFKFAEIIQKYQVTILKCGSTYLRHLMTKSDISNHFLKYNFSSLRMASFCAEPVNKEVHEFAKKAICQNFINSYWATEHGGIVWSYPDSYLDANPPTIRNLPLPWINAKVYNFEDGRECENGEQGDILITKPYPYLFLTIWGDPLNVNSSEWKGDIARLNEYYDNSLKYFRQGDYAQKDTNNFYSFHGRSDEVLNISGNRIGIEELENLILSCTNVKNGIVIGINDDIHGEIILPFIVVKSNSKLDFLEIKNKIKSSLGLAFIPQDYVEVLDLPKTFTGKFSRKILKILTDQNQNQSQNLEKLLPSIENPSCIPIIKQAISAWQQRINAKKNKQIFNNLEKSKVYDFLVKLAAKYQITDINIPWMDAGLDSISMVEFAEDIQTAFKDFIILESTVLFDYPNIDKLVEKIVGKEKQDSLIKPYNDSINSTIAVVGFSCNFPGNSDNPDKFWKFLISKGNGMLPITKFNLNDYPEIYVTKAAYISSLDFDGSLFGISDQEAELMDNRHKLLLIQNYEAILQAGYTKNDLMDSSTGVYVGIDANENSYPNGYGAYTATGRAGSIASNRLSFIFGLKGPSMSIDTACSSGLVALDIACKSLVLGDCDKALVSSVNLLSKPDMFRACCAAKMLSPNCRCATFSDQADGYARGEGCAAIMIENISISENKQHWGIIKSTAIVQDGKTANLTSPNGPSQEEMLRLALVKANLKITDITYIESHGTGTALGDPIEINALANVFGRSSKLYVGALKSNIGHLEPAAGIAGLIKALMVCYNRQIPPNIHCQNINPLIEKHLERSNLYFPKQTITLSSSDIINVGISSFGFGGTNSHVILQSSNKVNFDSYSHRWNLSSKDKILQRIDTLQIRAMSKIIVDTQQSMNYIISLNLDSEVYFYNSYPQNFDYIVDKITSWTDTQNYIVTQNSELMMNCKTHFQSIQILPSYPYITTPSEFSTVFKETFSSKPAKLNDCPLIPFNIDCLVVGAGIAGLLMAQSLSKTREVLVLEKEDYVGGIWYTQANTTSRVNSSEGAYRLINKTKTNIDHTPTHQIMQDLVTIANNDLQNKIKTGIEVLDITSKNDYFNITYKFQGTVGILQANKVFVCINRRLGKLRQINYPGEGDFKGNICYGVSNQIEAIDFKNKRVLILGSGAFAIEQVRTTLEQGAREVVVLSRQRGTVCPLIVDYLNFIRPYDKYFAHNKNGSTAIFQAWKDAFKKLNVTEPECWKEGKMTPHGHTISVSDIWLLGHYYGILSTKVGEIKNIYDDYVITDKNHKIDCDVIIKCTGFEKNQTVRKLVKSDQVYANNVVADNLVYLAENVLDDVGGYQSPFGSSYLEAVRISIIYILQELNTTNRITGYGDKVDIVDFPISKNTQMLQDLIKDSTKYEIAEEMRKHVIRRSYEYHKRFLPEVFLRENQREWNNLCDLLEERALNNMERPDYPFVNLLDSIVQEWKNLDLTVGNLDSFTDLEYLEVKSGIAKWVNDAAILQENKESKPKDISNSQKENSNTLSLTLIKSLLKQDNIQLYLEDIFRDEIKSFLCKLIGNSPEDYENDEPLTLYGLDSLSVIELLDYVGVNIDDIDIDTMSIDTIIELFK